MYFKKKFFTQQSREKRKKAYINVKNEIRSQSNQSLFYANQLLFYTDFSIHENTQWLDILFLSKKTNLFYNATIETTRTAWDILSSRSNGNQSDIFVTEKYEIIPDFYYGIGLDIWINAPALTINNIENAIITFLNNGEVSLTGHKQLNYKK